VNSDSLAPNAVQVMLRPHLWHRREVLALSLFVPFSISTWWREPDPGPLWALVLVVALIVAARWPGRPWLAISDSDVSCTWHLASARTTDTCRALRAEIVAVGVWRDRVVFSGENDQVILSVRPCWTLAQCADMAARLGVPLVRHRGRKGRR
jgi:hypothetical protein